MDPRPTDERPLVHVHLWDLVDPVIIVPAPTGIVYANQVNGIACDHDALEGYLLPLPRIDAEIFQRDFWERHFNRRMRSDGDVVWLPLCDRMEAALASVLVDADSLARDVRVARDQYGCEAWMPVTFDFLDMGPEGDGTATVRRAGVLTWADCD